MFAALKLAIDRRFRKKSFAEKVLNGVKTQLLGSADFVKVHVEIQERKRNEEIAVWKDRHRRLSEKYSELILHGYKSRNQYFESSHAIDTDTDMKLLDIIHDINQLSVSDEEKAAYIVTLNEYDNEIASSQKVLNMIEKMSLIASFARISSLDDIDTLFLDSGCELLLSMPGIINVPEAIREQYRA